MTNFFQPISPEQREAFMKRSYGYLAPNMEESYAPVALPQNLPNQQVPVPNSPVPTQFGAYPAVPPAPAAPNTNTAQQYMPFSTGATVPQNPQQLQQQLQQMQAQQQQQQASGAQNNAQNISAIVKQAATLISTQTPQVGKLPEWAAFYQMPNAQTLSALIVRIARAAMQVKLQAGSQQQQQPQATPAPTQTANAASQAAQTQTAAQPQARPQVTAQNSSKHLKFRKTLNISEAKKRERMIFNSIFEDDQQETKPNIQDNEPQKKKAADPISGVHAANPQKTDAPAAPDKGGSKGASLGVEMEAPKVNANVDDGDSAVGGTEENPFEDTEEVTYSKEYDSPKFKAKPAEMHMTPTNPEPFNPEHPSLTDFSDPGKIDKTVFTSSKGGGSGAKTAQDSKPVGNQAAPKDDTPSPASKSKAKPESHEDDGSDDEVSEEEEFSTLGDFSMNESISDSTAETIINEFAEKNDTDNVSIAGIIDFLKKNYPRVLDDSSATDLIIRQIQEISEKPTVREADGDETGLEGDDDVEADDQTIDEPQGDDGSDDFEDNYTGSDEEPDEFETEDGHIDFDESKKVSKYLKKRRLFESAIREYEKKTESPEFDSRDAYGWLLENHAEFRNRKNEFLYEVKKFYESDKLNETIGDDFYSNEPALN